MNKSNHIIQSIDPSLSQICGAKEILRSEITTSLEAVWIVGRSKLIHNII